ncbi:MAG: M81 family metallopeptidase [Hyphomicrobiales bacterium]
MSSERHIFLCEIMHESNTFNRIATVKEDFLARYYLTGDDIPRKLKDTNTEVCGVLEAAKNFGWKVTHPLAASASPSGPMASDDWNEVKRLILGPLEKGAQFDAIFLVLHGSMVTENCDDAEGELLEEIRKLAGDTPVAVTLDMHANVSQRMVDNAAIMMAYRTYPHVDQYERGKHLMELLKRILDENLETEQHFVRRPMLDAADHGQTGKKPMQKLLRMAGEVEREPGVLCASIQIGFPWSDVPDIGPSVLVTGLKSQHGSCCKNAERLAQSVWESRTETQLEFATPEDAMTKAGLGKSGDKPLILADFADNPAGGAYGDSPNLLRAMVDAGLQNAAFATICDPQAVEAAALAGVNSKITLNLGGKHAPELTPPLSLTGEVVQITDGKFVCDGPMWKGVEFSMGPTTVIHANGLEIIISSVPVAVMDRQVFLSTGIDPATKTTIGLKSRNHFRAAYEPLARDVMLVDAGGIASMKLADLPYKKISRPIWPLDDF